MTHKPSCPAGWLPCAAVVSFGRAQPSLHLTQHRPCVLPLKVTWQFTHVYLDHTTLQEIASDILAEQSPKRLYLVRGKYYELLTNCIPPELILKRLLLELVKRLDDELKHKATDLAAKYEHRLQVSHAWGWRLRHADSTGPQTWPLSMHKGCRQALAYLARHQLGDIAQSDSHRGMSISCNCVLLGSSRQQHDDKHYNIQ